MTILFVRGVNDQSQVRVDIDKKGKIRYILDGSCAVYGKLPLKKGIAGSVFVFGKGVRQQGLNFPKPSLIFNQISDPDSHSGALDRCAELCAKVPAPVINHPQHIKKTTRDGVAESLQGIPGVIMPRTLRFQPTSCRDVMEYAAAQSVAFPYIVRIAGDHNGRSMVLLKGEGDRDGLEALPFDGRDFYLTEYVDYADDQGHYHKQRIAVIDGEPFLRHAIYGDGWNVHGDSRKFMLERETWADDRKRTEWLETEVLPKARPAIRKIRERLGLEHFGIDCNLAPDGTMLIFEANANMNILFNKYPEHEDRMKDLHGRIQAMLARYSGLEVI